MIRCRTESWSAILLELGPSKLPSGWLFVVVENGIYHRCDLQSLGVVFDHHLRLRPFTVKSAVWTTYVRIYTFRLYFPPS